MNARINLSVLLAGAGLILAFLPNQSGTTLRLKPSRLIEKSLDANHSFTVDQVARFINTEDSTILLVDVRKPSEYMKCNIPGSINIPFADLLNPDWEGWINQKKQRIVYYSNGETESSIAWAIATGMGFKNSFTMKGGLNEWFKTVMLTRFEGETITPRENALFENRYKARRMFIDMNSLPDSLKLKYLETRRLKRERLDGGC
jgi:rhodanese-related sulfurtransferase